LAVVVLKDEKTATQEELICYIEPRFAKWWLPDRVEFVEEIPKTSVGKFKKSELRAHFADKADSTSEVSPEVPGTYA
jgi:fatty-acyl-CoA synthase